MSKEYRKYPMVEEVKSKTEDLEEYTSIIIEELYDANVTNESFEALENLKREIKEIEELLKHPDLMKGEWD